MSTKSLEAGFLRSRQMKECSKARARAASETGCEPKRRRTSDGQTPPRALFATSAAAGAPPSPVAGGLC